MPNWKKLIVSGSDAVLNTVTASGFLGNLTGTASWATNASSASVTQDNSTNTTRYLVFSDSNTTGPQVLRNDSALTYNPSSDTVTAAFFSGVATNASNVYVTDADAGVWGAGDVSLLFTNTSVNSSTYRPVYGDNEITYNPSTNTLKLVAGSTQSFGDNTLLSMTNNTKFVMGDAAIVNVGSVGSGRYADVLVSGSMNLYRSGSSILTVSGSGGAIMNIVDDNSSVIFEVVSGSNTLFAVDSGPTVIMSGSVLMYALPTSSTAASILTYNSSTGQVFSSSPPSKAGSASAASFGGSPRTSSVTFPTAYANNNYSVTVTGTDARTWTIQSKTAAGFTINSNSTTALTGATFWIASAW